MDVTWATELRLKGMNGDTRERRGAEMLRRKL